MFVSGKKIFFMIGFKLREGYEFFLWLVLIENLDIIFDNILCICFKCGGNLYINKKVYNCFNYRDEFIKCDFVIWCEMLGCIIIFEEVIEFCEKKEILVLIGFYDKKG